MGEIKEFHCTYDNSAGVNEEVTRKLNLQFPDAYMHWETMAVLSKALKAHVGASFCELPFCHTAEAEAMDGLYDSGRPFAAVPHFIDDVLIEFGFMADEKHSPAVFL